MSVKSGEDLLEVNIIWKSPRWWINYRYEGIRGEAPVVNQQNGMFVNREDELEAVQQAELWLDSNHPGWRSYNFVPEHLRDPRWYYHI